MENKKTWKGGGHWVGRPSPLGNPYSHVCGTLAEFKVATRDDGGGDGKGMQAGRVGVRCGAEHVGVSQAPFGLLEGVSGRDGACDDEVWRVREGGVRDGGVGHVLFREEGVGEIGP